MSLAVLVYDDTLVENLLERGVRIDVVIGERTNSDYAIAKEAGLKTVILRRSHYGYPREGWNCWQFSRNIANVLTGHGIDVALLSSGAMPFDPVIFQYYSGWMLHVVERQFDNSPRPGERAVTVDLYTLSKILGGKIDPKDIKALEPTSSETGLT